MPGLLTAGMGLLGAGQSIYNSLQAQKNKDKLKRIREKEVNEALDQNLANRERIQARSPESMRRRKSGAVRSAMEGAVAQAANIGAGQASSSGLGGDVTSSQISSTKAAAPVAQAMSPYSEQLAQTFSQQEQQENIQDQQLGRNTMDRAKIADMTAYINQSDDTPGMFSHVLSGLTGGMTAGGKIAGLLGDDNKHVGGEDPAVLQADMQPSAAGEADIIGNMRGGFGSQGYNPQLRNLGKKQTGRGTSGGYQFDPQAFNDLMTNILGG